eukprot:TRINITY_DN10129_c0_g1_i1.p1 TRINITY_DN10129_c0_g1~~TRINITY_DN10129_c0_g1_i1.p1  ORF type:complete len:117 (-),score=25.06 TRINITY_DN10129_c0_g1_i1:149-499(-)
MPFFEWCCPECFTHECNCRCGESCFCGGIAVWLAAGVFWIMGVVVPLFANSPTYHGINDVFFYMAYAFLIIGPIYAICARGKLAFSREAEPPLLQTEDEEEGTAAKAPVPYVMLAA